MDPLMQRLGLSLIEVPIAVGLAFAGFSGTFTLGCSITHCVDVSGLPWMLLGAVVGLGIGLGYWIGMLIKKPRLPVRLVMDGIALAIGLGSYLVPVILSERANARSVAANAKLNQERRQLRAEWIESLKAHSHGPPGEVPPMLTVVDEGEDAIVTNPTGHWTSVALARVLPDPRATGGFRACPMYTAGGRAFRYSVGPSKSERYRPAPDCAKAFSGAPIEYRVGDDPREQGWWSDSAIATPDWPNPMDPDRRMPAGGIPASPPRINIDVQPKAR